MNKLTLQEAKKYFNKPKQHYEAMKRNGFYLPPFNSPLVTGPWMTEVMLQTGKVWCPKFDQIKLRPCCKKPHKKDIYLAFKAALARNKLDMGVRRINQVDREYMLEIISTLEPDHAYFKKSFNPVIRKANSKPVEYVDNINDFFTDLPMMGLYTKGRTIPGKIPK